MTARLCRGSPARRSCFSSRRWWFTAVPALLCTFPAAWHNVHTAESTHAHPPSAFPINPEGSRSQLGSSKPCKPRRQVGHPPTNMEQRRKFADDWNQRARQPLFIATGVLDSGTTAPSIASPLPPPPAGSCPDSSTARLRWEGSPLDMWKWRAGTEMFAPEIQWRLGVPACQSWQCQRRELDDFSLHAPVIMARPVIIATASRPILPFPHPSGCSAVQRRGNWRTEHTHRKRWLGKLGWLTECPFPLHPSPPTWRRSLIASPDLALLKLPALAGGVATWLEPGPPSPGGGSYSQG